MHKPRFATFWQGAALSPYEVACLKSFTAKGYELAVYSYQPVADLPGEFLAKDARAILPPDSIGLFAVSGKPSVAHFTDYFRFVLFTKTDEIWVDTDLLLLKEFTLDTSGNFMGKESPSSVCTAILRLDPRDPKLASMIARVEALSKQRLVWGDTGPRLLTSVYGADAGLPQNVLYPVHYDEYYKVFLPEHRAECERLCAQATTLHLWNNLVVAMGIFKRIGPPIGSFLHAVFERSGSNGQFAEFYPESVMKAMVHNAVVKVGEDAGISKVVQLIGPCMRSTVARRWPALVR